jgi:hypothetical protein
VRVAMKDIEKLNQLTESHGALRPGKGLVSGVIALFNIACGRARWLALGAFVLVALGALLGGHTVPVADFADNTPSIGLDWFILDLLGSSLIFVGIEKLFALRKQQSDLQWPQRYGGVGDDVPSGFFKQLGFAFAWKG